LLPFWGRVRKALLGSPDQTGSQLRTLRTGRLKKVHMRAFFQRKDQPEKFQKGGLSREEDGNRWNPRHQVRESKKGTLGLQTRQRESHMKSLGVLETEGKKKIGVDSTTNL